MSKKYLMIITTGILIFLYFGFATDVFRSRNVTDFLSCVAYGNPIMESYPRQCRDEEDNVFVEGLVPTSESFIRVDSPEEGSNVSSPFTIKGEAVGSWFFEATFPIDLVSESGDLIKSYYAEASGEWMTEKFVPFSSSMEFSIATKTKGYIVLKKDNPSGLPEDDASVRIPVYFVPGKGSVDIQTDGLEIGGCVVGGCSSQICAEMTIEPIISTCEFREEYACLKDSKCEKQTNGKCGWTETSAYKQCMASLGPATF